jgi:dihydrofolate reductase
MQTRDVVIVEAVRTLALIARDDVIAGVLNRNGLKTGHTDEAGWCIAASATRDGRSIVVVVLGADTARSCLTAGVIDEILVHIVPVLLGDGVRLHEHPGGTNIKLERISMTESPQVANLWFRVVSRDMPHRLTWDG